MMHDYTAFAGPTPAFDHVVVINDFSGRVGGAETVALLAAESFAKNGARVTFICGDDGAAFPLRHPNLTLMALGQAAITAGSMLKDGLRGLVNRQAEAFLSAFIRANDTARTVYYLHNWSKIFSPSAFTALKNVAGRLIVAAHDFALVCPNLSYSNFQKGGEACALTPLSAKCLTTHCDRSSYLHKLWRVARVLQRRAVFDLAASKAIITVIHPDLVEYFVRAGASRKQIRIVRNPVRPYSRTRIAAESNTDAFFIGRVAYEKGADLAAEAARMANRRLRLIGDGEELENLRQRYPDVVFEGWRTHAEISALMAEARVLLVPSRLPETFTLVAHEAMRSGVPVVTFEDVDCQEAAELGAALTAPPRTPAALAAALKRLDDDAVVARVSHAAFQFAHRFSNTEETWRRHLGALFCEQLGHAPEKQDGSCGAPSARTAAARGGAEAALRL